MPDAIRDLAVPAGPGAAGVEVVGECRDAADEPKPESASARNQSDRRREQMLCRRSVALRSRAGVGHGGGTELGLLLYGLTGGR